MDDENVVFRIGLDLDTWKFEEFLERGTHTIKEKFLEIPMDKRPLSGRWSCRRSCNGNTHVLVEFHTPISILYSLQLRAWLGDDPIRIKMDLRRMLERGYENTFDRLFCLKTDGKTTKIAGVWREF